MRWPWQKKSLQDSRCLGIELHQGKGFAVLREAGVVRECYRPAETDQGLDGLATWIAAQQLRGVSTVLSLDALDYELHLVEAPAVSDDELADALRFRMRDLLPQGAEKKVIQGFRLPADAYRRRLEMAFAAVIDHRRVKDLVRWCEQQELALHSITIPELSLLHLVAEVAPETAVGVLRLDAEDGMIYLYRDGGLYLSRRLNTGTQSLGGHAVAEGGFSLESDSRIDALALDIQRSLDYFDSQLGMGMVGQIWVLVPDNADVSELLPELERSVNIPVRSLLLDSVARQQGGEDLTASLAIALGNALLIEQGRAATAAGKVA
ncbi:hypothetical protein [Thalassolituus hydrocarboniclasticus]|uniref:MSHA biogenesis protein MshI n=1 Tax=Thalassolituus hydrocarboniclasticus TaxID=2742796 RepID=A0ABY6A7F2_9GAMM|nr:hypothetical protein [Thalassolituus hydrocarboniclasticus]UXD86553.1 hypothetical protein HUF19_03430 [Thalassolituus hydrocarboniclasticus]